MDSQLCLKFSKNFMTMLLVKLFIKFCSCMIEMGTMFVFFILLSGVCYSSLSYFKNFPEYALFISYFVFQCRCFLLCVQYMYVFMCICVYICINLHGYVCVCVCVCAQFECVCGGSVLGASLCQDTLCAKHQKLAVIGVL